MLIVRIYIPPVLMRQRTNDWIDQQLHERLGREHQAHFDRFADQLLVPLVQLRIVAGILCNTT